jgi:hypothetical protein
MSVIELNSNFLWELIKINTKNSLFDLLFSLFKKFNVPNSIAIAISARLETTNDVLKSGGNQKVLLFETQFLSNKHIVVGIQNTSNVFSQISVHHSIHVVTIVEEFQVEVILLKNKKHYPSKTLRLTALADHKRNVLTTLLRNPGIGVSYGIAKTTLVLTHFA